MPAEPRRHHAPNDLADRFALSMTRLLRFFADTFFARRYGHRASSGRLFRGGSGPQ
jgi:ubiquinol oxidase